MLAMLIAIALPVPFSKQATTVLGVWAGESRCVGMHPSCHDEHVVYRIDSVGPRSAVVRGSRVAAGDTVAMGALTCESDRPGRGVTCRIPLVNWHFWVAEGQLRGSLVLADSTEARRVAAQRVPPG